MLLDYGQLCIVQDSPMIQQVWWYWTHSFAESFHIQTDGLMCHLKSYV